MLVVGAIAPYAWFVEFGTRYLKARKFGTRYLKARKFLWRAIQRYLPQLGSIIGEAVRQAIEEARRI
jgi:hypothetical protein